MNSVTYVAGLVKNRSLAICLSVVTAAVMSPIALANGGAWSLDANTSYARFFEDSSSNPDSLNTGVARVTGKVNLDTNDLAGSFVDLSIFPAHEDWSHALSPEGDLPPGYVPDGSDHTLLTFKSKRILKSGDGVLKVTGDLTLTRVERSVTVTPSEAYAGPVYGDPHMRTITREVTILFPNPDGAILAGPVTSAMRQKKGALEMSGSVRIGDGEFPELSDAIRHTNWPPVVKDEHCEVPSVGEDFSGPVCTGKSIAATRPDNCDEPSVGEDYHGLICVPPAGNRTTVVLNLQLLRTVTESSK